MSLPVPAEHPHLAAPLQHQRSEAVSFGSNIHLGFEKGRSADAAIIGFGRAGKGAAAPTARQCGSGQPSRLQVVDGQTR